MFYDQILCALLLAATVRATTRAEFEAACAAMPAADNYTLVPLPDETKLMCYLYNSTEDHHSFAKAACQTNQTHLGAGELTQSTWTSGIRFATSAASPNFDRSAWFWYDNITQPAIPIKQTQPPWASNWSAYNDYDPGVAYFAYNFGISDSATGVTRARICEYFIITNFSSASVCDSKPASGVCDNVYAQQHRFKSSFKSLSMSKQEGSISILANHTNVPNEIECLKLCHSYCQCLAVTYKADVNQCLLHWVSPHEDCFTTVPNSNAIIFYEY